MVSNNYPGTFDLHFLPPLLLPSSPPGKCRIVCGRVVVEHPETIHRIYASDSSLGRELCGQQLCDHRWEINFCCMDVSRFQSLFDSTVQSMQSCLLPCGFYKQSDDQIEELELRSCMWSRPMRQPSLKYDCIYRLPMGSGDKGKSRRFLKIFLSEAFVKGLCKKFLYQWSLSHKK